MKKNKLFSGLLALFISASLMLLSCNENDLSDQSFSDSNVSNASLSQKGTTTIEIDKDVAKTVALTFFSRSYDVDIESISIDSEKTIKDFDGKIAIYSFNINPSGFVLVSSNLRNVPIVAHSNKGTFEFNETSPDGLKSWIAENIIFNDLLEGLDKSVEEIDYQWYYLSEGRFPYPGDLEGNGGSPNYTVRYSHTENQQIGPLMQTTWRQGYPYSYYTPNNAPTGCVAVAMAQIMRYHEWPNTFNWPIMPNYSYYSSTSTGALEVASLMSDIGVKVNMQYSEFESEAYSTDARDALVNNYGYSSSANYSAYNFSTVKQEIKMYNRPVYMDGYHAYDTETTGWWFWEDTDITYTIGHAWVSDGYKQQYDVYIHNEGTQYEYTSQENRYEWLHMNWGWGPNYGGNGWFYQNLINNNGTTITVDENEVNPNFQYNRKCIYSIKK
ncbi:putative pyrogenic exotoxin B [Xanthomarina gelatinilytica]|uniref:Putative pyrogenic exotoxin B n=1 Tax=Xanthomarina gelatinilytica TaxID=1137281 RepID=M7MIA8_9FLAO|nr:C10 family peptidase [Xanthomarina gelatinilytica]EMQ96007.1 putative pyrogenic exotoxin B [Xanthomarina gelatinilytica]